jgi:hypothetical protein
MQPQVLQLDMQGTPQAWISVEHAASHYACESVVWFDGESPLATLHGGFNVARGVQSILDIHPIIAVRGVPKLNLFDVTPSRFEDFLLVGRNIRADVHEWLAARLPRGSRLC